MKRYERYKPSGVEWIGEIPERWKVKRLKSLSKLEYGESLAVIIREEGDIPVFGSNGITGFHSISITNAPCIVVGRKGSYGKINWSEKECFPIDTTYYIDNSKTGQHLRWLYYILPNLGLDLFSKDTGVPGLSREDAYQNLIPLPPFEEQTAIANYLDGKTAQIDTLIEKKQKLIELLKEERTAIINHAVTKGINPKVKLKHSGIDWLGDIPEHWEVKKLKYVLKINSGDGIKSEDIDFEGTYRVYGGNGIMGFTEKYNSDSTDIIIGRVGAKCGNVRLVNGKKWISDNALVAAVFDSYDIKYVSILLESLNLNALANQNAQPLITGTLVKGKIVMIPPSISEQTAIVHHIESHTTRIDTTISKIEKEKELMQEYRTALISEVVTGKIKVI